MVVVAREAYSDLGLGSVQRARILAATLDVLAEEGMGGMTVARIVARAGVSRRTFYEQFSGCGECFAALFEDALARARRVVIDALVAAEGAGGASSSRGAWRERVRTGLAALLDLFDAEPGLGSLLVVDALAAGTEVLARRARALEELTVLLEEQAERGRGARSAAAASQSPALTAEGIVGAVLAVIHRRMLERDGKPLRELLNPLMSMIVLPYLGRAAAHQELVRANNKPTPSSTVRAGLAGRRFGRSPATGPRRGPTQSGARRSDPLHGLQMRLTYRTLVALSAIANAPGASNRQIADAAGIHDQGQISKLLHRLQRLGLIENANGTGQARGEPNAWTLTPRGTEIQDAIGLTPDEAAAVAARA